MRGRQLLQRPVEPLAQLDLLGHARHRRLMRMIAEILGEVRIVQHPLMLLAVAELAHHVGRDPEKVGERIAHEVGIAHAQEPREHLLREIVRILRVRHPAGEETLQIPGMVAEVYVPQSKMVNK